MVQPATEVTPWVCLGVLYKALSAPLGPLTEAKEQALRRKDPELSAIWLKRNKSKLGIQSGDTTTISTRTNKQHIKQNRVSVVFNPAPTIPGLYNESLQNDSFTLLDVLEAFL